MRVDELMKLLADAPPEADVYFVNRKDSVILRSIIELEAFENDTFQGGKHLKEWVVVLKAEDQDEDEDEE